MACVGAEAAESVDFGSDGDGFPVDFDFGCAFDEESSEGAVALVSDDEDMSFGAPEVLFEVVEDASACAHAGSGEDQAGAGQVVELFGFIGGAGGAEVFWVGGEGALAFPLAGFFIDEFGMIAVDAAGFDGHGAIEADGEGMDFAFMEQDGEVVGHLLGATYGEGGDQHFAAVFDRFGDDILEFGDGVIVGAVVMVAVSGFQEDEVSGAERFIFPEDGHSFWAEISREDDRFGLAFVLDGQLDACGAQEVAGFGEEGGDSRGDGDGLVEGDGLGLGEELFDGGGVVEGEEGFQAGAFAFAVGSFEVLDLEAGGVGEDEFCEFQRGLGGEDFTWEAAFDEEGEAPGMVEVGVGDEDCVEPFRVAGSGESVEGFCLFSALVEAGIDEDSGGGCFEEVGRSGHFPACGAECGDLHGGVVGG